MQYYLEPTVTVGKNVIIQPFAVVKGNTVLEDGCVVESFSYLDNAHVGKNTEIRSSRITDSTVGKDCTVGPNAHIRQGSVVGDNCRIGNYVELKNSTLGNGTKASHLAYIGDATVGKNCNIGCGVIFCNYDGTRKAHSVVEDECFVGSNVNLVAPVKVGKGSYIAAGTTVTEDVPPGSFIIGRVRQQSHARLAEKYARGGTGGQGKG